MNFAISSSHTRIMPGNMDVEEHTTTNLNAASLWPFIEGQAVLHDTDISGKLENFKQHLVADKRRTEKSGKLRLLNCRLYTLDDEPRGYALFNPAFDNKGKLGFYLEDVFIDKEARGQGLGKIIWSQISKEAFQRGATFLKWSTDERNAPMIDFSERKLKAIRAHEDNLNATPLLGDQIVLNQNYLDEYETRPITIYDASALKQLGIDPGIASIAHKGLPLVGFVTKERDAPNTVVAATVAALNYSTFKTVWGINVEPMVFLPGVKEEQKDKIIHSTIDAIRNYKISKTEFNEYANGKTPPAPDIKFLKWHAAQNTMESSYLQREFKLSVDNMVDSERSNMILYLMPEESLHNVREMTP